MKQKFTDLSLKKQDESKTVTFHVNKEKGVVVCRLYDRWYDMYHIGKAHCLSTDKFSEKTGRALAFNRARQKELSHNIEMLDLMRKNLEELYNIELARLEKRKQLNEIYLAGVEDELKELVD